MQEIREASPKSVQQAPKSTQTIADFSEQWSMFPDNKGYFASVSLFLDSLAGLVTESDIKDKRVADLGSGTGRIVAWLARLGANHIYAIEPAASHEILKQNTREFASRISYVNTPGDQLDINNELDLVVSLGVISYIPELLPVFRAIHTSLKPQGKFFILAMSKEGNENYCRFVLPLRKLSVHLPDQALFALCCALALPATLYALLCTRLALPMRDYFANVYSKMNWHHRVMLIFDQLNPTFVQFLSRQELEQLFVEAGFKDIKLVHRHGYSWAAAAQK